MMSREDIGKAAFAAVVIIGASGAGLVGACAQTSNRGEVQPTLRSTIAFVMRGGSATWSPDGKQIAFHASASGKGQPIKLDPGPATSDNDVFVANMDDLLKSGARPTNITISPAAIDDDPDWSPDGRKIVYTTHPLRRPHS